MGVSFHVLAAPGFLPIHRDVRRGLDPDTGTTAVIDCYQRNHNVWADHYAFAEAAIQAKHQSLLC
jgi:hypothetical protein